MSGKSRFAVPPESNASTMIRFANLIKTVLICNKHIFMWEQVEYSKEGIDWSGINFADNKPVLVRNLAPGHPG